MAKQAHSPNELFALSAKMKGKDQSQFLRLIAGYVTGEALYEMSDSMTDRAKESFLAFFEKQVWDLHSGNVLMHAVTLAKENPEAAKKELALKVNDEFMLAQGRHYEEIRELLKAKIKEDRDRKSDPRTVTRNIEICDRRKENKKKWTLGRLEKEYGITERGIRKILSEEAYWRQIQCKPVPTS